MSFMEEFHHLKIQLEDIKSATNNFDDDKIIGIGGFGKVYKGSIFYSTGQIMVAFKRLDRRYGQGDPEFLKEIMMLSNYKHEHLISLLGFCNEDGEKILVYEHAAHGSLDRHLSATSLTWSQRLKICLEAARGVRYLHDPNGTQQRVLHRDIKSSNVLLDMNWNAKVSDFGLSKIGPANQQYSFIFSNVVGTPGYLDPQYLETYCLTKESDVYSFGVVLFEVLCGRLCYEYSEDRFRSLVPMWKRSYELNKLDHIIFQELKQPMDPVSLKTFLNIAYQCLQKTNKQRPTMARVVEELEIALEVQKTYDERIKYEEMIALEIQQSKDYEKIIKSAVPQLIYGSQEEMHTLISKGIFLNMGKTWFSLNKNGENCEMISAEECLIPLSNTNTYKDQYSHKYNSRFAFGSYLAYNWKFETHVRTQFLSPKTVYTVNLVFKIIKKNHPLSKWLRVGPTYVTVETNPSVLYFAEEREDGWLMAKLYKFTSESRNVDLEIVFDKPLTSYDSSVLAIEGIEFRPLEKLDHQVLEDEKDDHVQRKTTKKLYFFFSRGFPIKYDEGTKSRFIKVDGTNGLPSTSP